ncbi:MAG: 4Fe-4S binding protein, partial [Clostridiales bacterium]|nr:4Fe-4S binding protein [Clostridiales bacterium]
MVVFDNEKCTGCGLCIKDCVRKCLYLEAGKAKAGEGCFDCGHCLAICPQEAVSMPDHDMTEVIPYDKDSFGLDSVV